MYVHVLFAQEPLYINYTVANGLPSNEVHAIFKDSKGYLWISTDKGVCRYNGSEFKVFTTHDGLGDNTNFQIIEDRLGRIWFTGFNHFISYYEKGLFTSIPINKSLAENIGGYFIHDFKIDKDLNLYISIKGKNTLLKIEPPYNQYSVIEMENTELGLVHIDSKEWLSISNIINKKTDSLVYTDFGIDMKITAQCYVDKRKFNPKYNQVTKYIFNYTKEFTFIGIHNILLIRNNVSKEYVCIDFKDKISAISFDLLTGDVLIGYANYGIDVYNIFSKKTKRIFNEKIPITNIIAVNKEYWVSTITQGLIYIPNIQYNYFYKDSSTILSILPLAKDSLLTFTIFGKTKTITPRSIKEIHPEGFENTSYYWQKFNSENKGYLSYTGNMGYVYDIQKKRKIQLKNLPYLYKNFVPERIAFNDANIYWSSYVSLIITNKKGELNQIVKNESRITTLLEYNNKLLIGTFKGLKVLNNNKIEDLDTLSFLKNRVSCLVKTKNNKIIIGSRSNGIGIYDNEHKKILLINEKNGLENDFINDVKIDDENNIWVVSNRCFSKIVVNNDNTFRVINYTDIPIKQSTIQEIHLIDANIYLLANNTIIKFNKSDLEYTSEKYPFVMEQLNSNLHGYDVKKDTLFEISSAENSLKFNYQLLAFSSNGKFEYRYKVNKNDWQYTHNNTLDFSNLTGGTYQFYFQGRIIGGEWSNPYNVGVIIDYPFYKKTLFLLGLFLVLVLIGYIIVRLYIRKKIKREVEELAINKKLEGMRLTALRAQMNPHFVFNVINSVQNFILKNEKLEAYKYLTDFSNLIRNYLDYSSKDIISLQEEIDMIQLYLSLEQLRIPFQYSITIDEAIDITRTKIFTLMLQPFAENAIWHGLANKEGEKQITIQFKKINEKMSIFITDNGIGRKQASLFNKKRNTNSESFALKSMNNRIQSLNYLYDSMIEMEITDNYNKEKVATGTTINLMYELTKI
jgi:sensor histidine kinase YesM